MAGAMPVVTAQLIAYTAADDRASDRAAAIAAGGLADAADVDDLGEVALGFVERSQIV